MSQYGGRQQDDIGTMAVLGGSGNEKLLIQLPSEAEKLAPVANTLLRSRISEKLRGYYGLAATLAGDHKPTLAFITNMSAAGLGVEGFARNEFLMGLSRMLVPSAMPSHQAHQFGGDGQGNRAGATARTKKGAKEDDE